MAKKKQAEPGVLDIGVFLAKAVSAGKDIFVGIDPGVDGAIAMICRNHYVVVDIPVVEISRVYSRKIKKKEGEPEGGPKTKTVHGKTKKFDHAAILEIFRPLRAFKKRVHVCLEIGKPMITGKGGNNVRTAHLTGIGYGMWPLFIMSKRYASFEEFEPAYWKKSLQLTNKDKEASRLKAKGLFPKAPLTRKGDHNRAEALLLAETLRRRRGQDEQGKPDSDS